MLPDGGAGQTTRTTRGGIIIEEADFNPGRVKVDDLLIPGMMPAFDVGATIPGAIVGSVDYNFGNFGILATSVPAGVPSAITREVTQAADDPDELAVATFNVENLDPGDPDAKFQQLATMIVNNLQAPDLISLEEIQDNNGPTNNGIVAADQTLAELIAAIQAAGGPTYQFRQIDPENHSGWRGARRQYPRRIPVPHRSRPGVRRPAGSDLDDSQHRRRRCRRARAPVQPWPDRPDQHGLQHQP